MWRAIGILVYGLAGSSGFLIAATDRPSRPNIVLLVSDDMGWNEWLETRDLLAYGQKLAPWLDGLCRIQVPAHMTKSGKVEEFTFTPDGLDIFEKPSYGPHSYQDMIDAVYKTAGTAD